MNITTLPCELASPPDATGKLVVVLHGRGDSSAGFHWMPRALGLKGVSYLLVNAPDLWVGGGRSWYDLPPDHMQGIQRSRKKLEALFSEVFAQGYTPESTALFGFSQGCLMTLEWGGRTELPLAGCCGVSGYVGDVEALHDEMSDAAIARPWLVTHGRQDPVVPFDRTESQMELLKMGGLPVDFRAYDKVHTIDPDLPDIRTFLGRVLGL
ncbi:MAG: alpha/beta hydrolase [Myxococcota bacterium]